MTTRPAASPAWPSFHAAVLADEGLLARLLATPDAASFRAAALTNAAEGAIPLAAAELDAAIATARQAWLARKVGL